jgi:hypothetical protein
MSFPNVPPLGDLAALLSALAYLIIAIAALIRALRKRSPRDS